MMRRFGRISISRKRYEELLRAEVTLELVTKLVKADEIYSSTLKSILVLTNDEEKEVSSNDDSK